MSLGPHLRYFVEDAVEEWRHSPGPAALATATLVAVLLVGGLVLLVLANADRGIDAWSRDQRVQVFLRDGASAGDLAALKAKLEAVPGVARVVFVGKDEALLRFRRAFRALKDVPAQLGENPLPASFDCYLAPGPSASAVAKTLAATVDGAPGLEEVRYDRDLLLRVEGLLDVARWAGGGLGAVVVGAIVFVMAGVMRLAVYARRDEVDIMLLVGASPALVRGPFLLAGLLQGAVAGVASLGLVEIARRAALTYAGPDPSPLLLFLAGTSLPARPALLLLGIGIAVGLLSAWFAVRRLE